LFGDPNERGHPDVNRAPSDANGGFYGQGLGPLARVSSNDPLVYCGASLIFALVALGACLIPARRAAKIGLPRWDNYEDR
jgi:hypothetical protein